MMILWVIVIGFVVYYVLKGDKSGIVVQKNDKASAMEVLDNRYAKGEIDEETYKKMKENLKS